MEHSDMPPATQTKSTPALRKTTETFAAGPKSLPQKYFVSPEIFADEQAKIFSTQWLLVGHQSQIEKPGDYFLAQVVGESLIIVRDQKSEIRGFYNVCRHRGTRLKEDASGHASAIQCPYHAWTYGLDGRLIGAPHMDEVPGFDKANYSLQPVNLELWEGFIFVNLVPKRDGYLSEENASAERGAYSLQEWFAPLAGKFSHWNMSVLQPAKRIEYNVRANWKLMFENYSECYHCPGVHPQLQKVSPYDSAENDLREGPFLGGFMKINPGKSLTMSGNACAAFVGEIENLQRVFYYTIFPNMLLSLHPEYVMVHQLWPQSPERTLIVCDWLFHPEAFKRKDFNPQDAIEFWDMTNKQDWHVCELSQQGIASRAYVPGPYSSRERIPAAWDEYYLRQMS
ncbi:MAG TPA: aromatic ring-hydroxylating dioxygenase subunit alpha [Chthoniobacterales bacterium]|nr:aromatic ring-hydroxylating dioxygenase subunit alpha [Chthoniobacterales bacterium]